MESLKFGIVSDTKPGYAKVYFEEDDIVTDWWPVLVRTSMKDFESWPLNIQEHVACVVGEHCEEGVVLGAIHSDPEPPDPGAGAGKFRKVFEDGTYLEYDKSAHRLTANVQGEVDVIATSDINATSQTNIKAKASILASIEAPTITLKGAVTVQGVITAGGLALTPMAGVTGADGKVQGDINISGSVNADADVKAGTVSLKTHIHSGVTTGSGTSGQPVP
jgi:phage baseplate assembly protein V